VRTRAKKKTLYHDHHSVERNEMRQLL